MAKKRPANTQDAGPPLAESEPTGISVRDPHAAPAGAVLDFISPDLRGLAIGIESLVLDDLNVKDHGDEDLPTHAASLKEFGIRRAVVVRRSNRKIEAGNGTVMAAKLNGWGFVPVIFEDDDNRRAKAFALADNAVGTLANWNEENLAKITAEVDALFDSDELKNLAAQVLSEIQEIEEGQEEEPEPTVVGNVIKAEDVVISYRVIATCRDQDEQIKLLAELSNRGHECRLNTLQLK